ncbi:hypothetical protein Q5P01_019988 [Channa striata]|uniref:Uncharacterized protein n=1 Tax=Channa striata TaxID=64152 RepID=A0AA88S2N9_CHASR|nr:hypothetical protein Q5P01_019988 [Channa striata]
MGAGFFPWSSLIKSAKNKHFDQQTLERLKVSKASVKTTYMEIVRTWLQKITGLSTKPVECHEFYKCNPCEAAFYRYPLNLQATAGCTTAMFRGSLACEAKRVRPPERGAEGGPRVQEGVESLETTCDSAELIPHPYQPFSKNFSNSRVLMAHRADRELVNRSGKLVAHCIVDYCLPRHMYGSPTESLSARREAVARLPGEKLEACLRVVTGDMYLSPGEVYESLSVELFACSDARISLSLPASMFADAGLACPTGRLSLLRSEVSERALVDLAGMLYQTVLMLQIRSPRAFASVPGAYPDSLLCIMPYSREDSDLIRTWLEAFKGSSPRELNSARGPLSRGGELDRKEATYHCTGCKNFYRDLFVSKVLGDTLFRIVYGSGNKRLLGHCVNEAWWIP